MEKQFKLIKKIAEKVHYLGTIKGYIDKSKCEVTRKAWTAEYNRLKLEADDLFYSLAKSIVEVHGKRNRVFTFIINERRRLITTNLQTEKLLELLTMIYGKEPKILLITDIKEKK